MYGAILGDMIGAPYEFDRGDKTKDFELFDPRKGVRYTDDSAMSLAIAKAIMNAGINADERTMKKEFISCMQDIGNRYAKGEYGVRFASWLSTPNPKPYGSFGNGSAMRVSCIGWLFDSMERIREVARWSAEVTHNHPEGIKGAESVAAAIYMARHGLSKEEIKKYVADQFGYNLNRTCDEIRQTYHHVESCQETVPEAFTAFLEGNDFEDVIRTAVSLGGDCDTLTCIAGGMAEAFYGVPKNLKKECEKRLPEEFLAILNGFTFMVYQNGTKEKKIDAGEEGEEPGFVGKKEYTDTDVDKRKEDLKGINRQSIELIHGSCADQKVDVIVNAANKYLAAGGGICGVIFHRAGMKSLTEACQKCKTPLKDGEAVITSAFQMTNANAIIHAVGPDFNISPNAFEALFNAYYNSLVLMKKYEYHSIAFPLISAGIFGGSMKYPAGESMNQGYNAYRKFCTDFPNYDVKVLMCAFTANEYVLAKKEFDFWNRISKHT